MKPSEDTRVENPFRESQNSEDKMSPLENIIDLNMHLANGQTEAKFWCSVCIIYFSYECDLINHKFIHIESILAKVAAIKKKEQEELIAKQSVLEITKADEPEHDDSDFGIADDMSYGETEEKPIKEKKPKQKRFKKSDQKDNESKKKIKKSEKDKKVKTIKVIRRKRNIPPDRIFLCDHCQYRTNDKCNLKTHIVIHFDNRPFSCDKCSYTCKRRSVLTKHYISHTDIRSFPCSECGQAFKSSSDRSRHEILHRDKTFTCEICGKKFSHIYGLRNHVKTHSEDRPFVCDICPYSTKDPNYLKVHKTRHDLVKRFSCEDCNYATSVRATFLDHVRQHVREMLRCDKCPYTTKGPRCLRRHKKLHDNNTSLVCDHCQQFFKNERALKRHIRIHATVGLI